MQLDWASRNDSPVQQWLGRRAGHVHAGEVSLFCPCKPLLHRYTQVVHVAVYSLNHGGLHGQPRRMWMCTSHIDVLSPRRQWV